MRTDRFASKPATHHDITAIQNMIAEEGHPLALPKARAYLEGLGHSDLAARKLIRNAIDVGDFRQDAQFRLVLPALQ